MRRVKRGKEDAERRRYRREREEGTGRLRVWAEEMEGRPIRGRKDLSAGDGCADSEG